MTRAPSLTSLSTWEKKNTDVNFGEAAVREVDAEEEEASPECATECFYPSNHGWDGTRVALQTESGSHSDHRGRTLSRKQVVTIATDRTRPLLAIRKSIRWSVKEKKKKKTPTERKRNPSEDLPQLRPAAPHCRPLWSYNRTAPCSFLTHKLILSQVWAETLQHVQEERDLRRRVELMSTIKSQILIKNPWRKIPEGAELQSPGPDRCTHPEEEWRESAVTSLTQTYWRRRDLTPANKQ